MKWKLRFWVYSLGLYRDYRVYIYIYRSGLHRENGKESGTYYNGLYTDHRVYVGAI